HMDAARFQLQSHVRAQIEIVVRRGNGEVAFLVAWAITKIVFRAAGVPAALFRIDEVKPVLLALIEAHIVENKKLRFRAEESLVRNSREAEIGFRFARNVARVARIRL